MSDRATILNDYYGVSAELNLVGEYQTRSSYYAPKSKKYIQTTTIFNLHPEIKKALYLLDSGKAQGIRYDLIDQLQNYTDSRLRLMSGYRPAAEQVALVEKGVSRAKPYESFHNWGLAIDIIPRETGYGAKTFIDDSGSLMDLNFSNKKAWEKIGFPLWWKSLSSDGYIFEWGGDWKDFPDLAHFQVKTRIPTDKQLSDDLGSVLKKRWWDIKEVPLVKEVKKKKFPWWIILLIWAIFEIIRRVKK